MEEREKEADNIQKAIDAVKESGGGVVYLRAGTYIVNEAIIGYSYVDIEGENMSSTIIDFNPRSFSSRVISLKISIPCKFP